MVATKITHAGLADWGLTDLLVNKHDG